MPNPNALIWLGARAKDTATASNKYKITMPDRVSRSKRPSEPHKT